MRAVLISALARSLLAGNLTVDETHARAVRTLGRDWRWLQPLALRYVEHFSNHPRHRHRDAVQFLKHDAGFLAAFRKHRNQIAIAEWLTEPQRMQPVPATERWNLPRIETPAALADWLCLDPNELAWFADLKLLGNKLRNPKLQHYHYSVLAKRSGATRLIETPKPWLKHIQRRILTGILNRIPPHPSAHGFVKRRSIATFAAPHAARPTVLRLDLRDFFPAFPAARVHAVFRTLGYPEPLAGLLTGLSTNAVPHQVSRDPLYARPHLPQGAPTSPALANIMAFRLDCRLTGLAKSAGAAYTRYADDLAFSALHPAGNGAVDRPREVNFNRFAAHAAAIALEEGFHVNHHKTRILRQGVRQQIAGVVVNHIPTPPRRDLDLLEAILTNCIRRGPESQNRASHPDFRAHLEGRVGYVEMIHRAKGARLRSLFRKINWP
jgi:RNA-directed DNA polymerase